MHTLFQDIRYSLRQLRNAPSFAFTAVLTLALGIGATTAIFTLVYQVILRSIPVTHPEQIYKVGRSLDCCVDGGLQNDWTLFSDDLYRYLRDQTPGTDGILAVQGGAITVTATRPGDNGTAIPLDVRFVSGNYFPVLGVTPSTGRLLSPSDDREGASPTAVLSYAFWQSRFAGDPHLVGSTVMFSGHPVTIVGIAAANFLGEKNEETPPALWVPIAFEPLLQPDRQLLKFPATHWLNILIRVHNPNQVAPIQAALQGELHQWISAHRDHFEGASAKDLARQTTELTPARDGINVLSDEYKSSLKLLQFVAGFVLLIACANLANLMLVRGMARQQELSVRTALGAPRTRLIRQTLIESVLLSIAGGITAVFIAYLGSGAIIALALPNTQSAAQVNPLSASPSLPILAFAFIVSVATGILFGIAPAWITSRANPAEALRGANRSTRDASALPQKAMVILQAALSLALLTTAGLLIVSLRNLQHQDFRFQPQGSLYLNINLQAAGYTYDRLPELYRRFDDTFPHLSGVQAFGYATYAPMSGDRWGTGVFFPDVPFNPRSDPSASYLAVSPGFFAATGTRLILGRGITEQDTATSTHVALVSQAFVNHFFKGRNPIGEHFGERIHSTNDFQIVGVVDDAKYRNPSEPAPPMFFTPIAQTTPYTDPRDIKAEEFKHFAANIIVRYQGDQSTVAASVRQALRSIDPQIPILEITSYQNKLDDSFTQENLVVRLTSLFGILALTLASIGLYGVTSYAVARRTSEIGIRMALGASRTGILSMVLRYSLTQAALGLALGLPLAYLGGRLVQHTLYQTSAFQPVVLLAVIALLVLSALAASFIPARRAATLDPMQALRTE